jgi:hypothetical protein
VALIFTSPFYSIFYLSMRNISLLVAIFTAIALIAGCGDGRLRTIVVTGTVTFDGEPLEGASVTFTPQSEGHPAFGITNANGRYTLQTILGNPDAGTTPGDYEVAITKLEVLPPRTEEEEALGLPPPRPRSLIPERYGATATSGLNAAVRRGESNVFNFDLTR